MMRFLTMCRLLSVGKRAALQPGTPRGSIRARPDPEFIYEQTEKQLEEYYGQLGHAVTWNKLFSADDRVKKTFLIREQEGAQAWVSTLTGDWMGNLSDEIGFEGTMRRFLKSTIVTSPRSIDCVAAYASILPIRAEWLIRRTPILMLVRRLCTKGYHSAFYRVLPNSSTWSSSSTISDSLALEIGERSWFDIEPVSISEVQSASWATSPHFIAISNSLSEGANIKVYDHITENDYNESAAPPYPHNDDTCCEHTAHATEVLESNFSGILMEFFAKHAQYPFDLLRGQAEDESVYLTSKMQENTLSAGAMESYSRAYTESTETGSNSPYIFEHMYAELPFVVGRQVAEIVEKGTKPVPIGYRWA